VDKITTIKFNNQIWIELKKKALDKQIKFNELLNIICKEYLGKNTDVDDKKEVGLL